jgi:methylmalonyl-CoA/ethylmalonyl-CoA epimerase
MLEGRTLHHVGIAVNDLASGLAPYRAIGLEPDAGVAAIPALRVRVATVQLGGTFIELLEPMPGDGPLARFLSRRGPGLHHIAVGVTNLEAELERARAESLELVDQSPREGLHGTRVAFIHPRAMGGVLVELVEVRPTAREADHG